MLCEHDKWSYTDGRDLLSVRGLDARGFARGWVLCEHDKRLSDLREEWLGARVG